MQLVYQKWITMHPLKLYSIIILLASLGLKDWCQKYAESNLGVKTFQKLRSSPILTR